MCSFTDKETGSLSGCPAAENAPVIGLNGLLRASHVRVGDHVTRCRSQVGPAEVAGCQQEPGGGLALWEEGGGCRRFVRNAGRMSPSGKGRGSWTMPFFFLMVLLGGGPWGCRALSVNTECPPLWAPAPSLPPPPKSSECLSPDGLHNEKRCQSGLH